MQFRFPYIFFFIFAILGFASAHAQKSKLAIQINNDRLRIDDTLDIVGTYTIGDKKLPPATLALVLKENDGNGIWQLRWPMIDGHAEGSLVFPKGFTPGNYTMYFAVQARFFRMFGKVLYPPTLKKITGVFFSPLIVPKQIDIPVENGNFEIGNILFENTAYLQLDFPQSKKMPAITMDAWLDSTFEPVAAISKEITVGLGAASVMENKKVDNWMAYFDPFYKTTILGNLSPIQKFDSVYVTDTFFKKNIVKQFDCLSDSSLMKSNGLENFLKKYFPGFRMNEAYDEDAIPTATANGYNFVFYLDEKQTSYALLNSIRLSDIATIKIISTKLTPSHHIIGLYTKQGPFVSQDFYRYKYIINGYQPSLYKLPLGSKMFATSPYNIF